jgi:hypothetical protein
MQLQGPVLRALAVFEDHAHGDSGRPAATSPAQRKGNSGQAAKSPAHNFIGCVILGKSPLILSSLICKMGLTAGPPPRSSETVRGKVSEASSPVLPRAQENEPLQPGVAHYLWSWRRGSG